MTTHKACTHTPRKAHTRPRLRPNTYRLMCEAVERGLRFGLNHGLEAMDDILLPVARQSIYDVMLDRCAREVELAMSEDFRF